jgi:ADP-ribosyl-[dinitrogen reductase] hydrolase
MKNKIKSALYGLAIGDAIGRLYEFRSPDEIPPYELIDIVPPDGFDPTYPHVPLGTWTDDTSQALALLDSLNRYPELNLNDFSSRLLDWLNNGSYTPDGLVFDVGIQTLQALNQIQNGYLPEHAGNNSEFANGNGSLMRCLPVVFHHHDSIETLVRTAIKQSIPTHPHPRSGVCCALYCLQAMELLYGNLYQSPDAFEPIISRFLTDAERQELGIIMNASHRFNPSGTGYVVDSLWSVDSVMNEADSYEDVIKFSIMFGNDTDTTAAIAGGLAGLKFGVDGIREDWIQGLKGIDKLFKCLSSTIDMA